uniref:Uncharacterized protein n=1 Tax=Anguilla anguilla TaxID=7936 RepID=A0A0E9UQ13_ANGAN
MKEERYLWTLLKRFEHTVKAFSHLLLIAGNISGYILFQTPQ